MSHSTQIYHLSHLPAAFASTNASNFAPKTSELATYISSYIVHKNSSLILPHDIYNNPYCIKAFYAVFKQLGLSIHHLISEQEAFAAYLVENGIMNGRVLISNMDAFFVEWTILYFENGKWTHIEIHKTDFKEDIFYQLVPIKWNHALKEYFLQGNIQQELQASLLDYENAENKAYYDADLSVVLGNDAFEGNYLSGFEKNIQALLDKIMLKNISSAQYLVCIGELANISVLTSYLSAKMEVPFREKEAFSYEKALLQGAELLKKGKDIYSSLEKNIEISFFSPEKQAYRLWEKGNICKDLLQVHYLPFYFTVFESQNITFEITIGNKIQKIVLPLIAIGFSEKTMIKNESIRFSKLKIGISVNPQKNIFLHISNVLDQAYIFPLSHD